MFQVREKLISKQISIERSEKAKKMRELRKFGKKVSSCWGVKNVLNYNLTLWRNHIKNAIMQQLSPVSKQIILNHSPFGQQLRESMI